MYIFIDIDFIDIEGRTDLPSLIEKKDIFVLFFPVKISFVTL